MRRGAIRRVVTRAGGWLLALLMLGSAAASAQDAQRGRALYVDICARCHSDPPGSGAINPLVRTPDEIRAAINRVSPMRFLGDALANTDLDDVAAYFAQVLGPPSNAPDFDVSGQWASMMQPWWGLYVTQFAQRTRLTGGWLTFDARGDPIWLHFHDSGSWTGPSIYTARLFRNSGPPFATPPGSGAAAPNGVDVGEIAFVFSSRDTADVTFVLEGQRIVHRIGRVTLPR